VGQLVALTHRQTHRQTELKILPHRMRNKYINSTSDREYLTENGFRDINVYISRENFSRPTLFFPYFSFFSLRMPSF